LTNIYPMQQQLLYELAERELNINRADPDVLATAYSSSGGVPSVTRQLYWQYRSQKLRLLAEESANPDEFWTSLVSEIDEAEHRAKRRRSLHAWIGAFACLLGWVLAYIFFRFAFRAQATGRAVALEYWTCSVVCLISGFYGFVVAKRNAY
jgi:hypothetical protein